VLSNLNFKNMQVESKILLQDLTERVVKASEKVQRFKSLPIEQLNHRDATDSWSILECIEHLNLYGDFYLPEIEQRILQAPHNQAVILFKNGWLGNYFALSMLPKNGKIQKMKTFKDKNPIHSSLDIITLERFLKQQECLLQLLREAERVNLTTTRTAISITKWVTLRLGDTLRFFTYHIERHIAQAERVNINSQK
jgi:DinB superfamily